MADEGGRKRRGPYLQYLSDSSDRVVPRTTRYRWDKKVRVAGDSQECGLERINSENQSDFTSLNPETELSDDDGSTAFGCHFPEQDSSYCSTEVDSVEPTWFANEGGEFVTVYRFEEFMSMTEEPALLTDGRQMWMIMKCHLPMISMMILKYVMRKRLIKRTLMNKMHPTNQVMMNTINLSILDAVCPLR